MSELVYRFNRNIVECKEKDHPRSRLSSVRFNRNIVECKEESCKKMMQRFWF